MANAAKDYSKATASMVQDKCVVLSVEFRNYGTSRKVDMDTVEVDADKSYMSAKKYIMDDSENLRQIHRIWSKGKALLWSKALPAPLKDGMMLIPNDLIDEVESSLNSLQKEAEPFIKALVKELPALKERDRKVLRAQFKESDYPTEAQVESAFYIYWQYVDFQVPDKLRKVSNAMYQKEVEKQTKSWSEAAEAAQAFLRETALGLVTQFANQLKVEKVEKRGNLKKGKEKRGRIYDSTIDKLKQFIEDLPARNIVGDTRIMALATMVQQAVNGVDADALRNDDGLRAKVAEEIETVKADLAGLMKQPMRIISLE
jgi:hypothetical protein